MPDTIYFQWQNEYLLRTIYPLREKKLRDFLSFYYEIEVWQQYKGLTPQTIQGEVQLFRNAQQQKAADALAKYDRLLTYLLTEDVTTSYQQSFPVLDGDIMTRINALHKTFKRFFPSYQNPVKEKYFTSEQARQLAELRKSLIAQITTKQRNLRNMGPAWGLKASTEKDLERLTTISLKMVDNELRILYEFLAAYERLFRYRQELAKRKAQMEKERLDAQSRLQPLKMQREVIQSNLDKVLRQLSRLRNPPNLATLKTYFLTANATSFYQARYADLDQEVMAQINELHRSFAQYFPSYNQQIAKEKYFVGQRMLEFEAFYRRKQEELASKQRLVQNMPPGHPSRAANENALARMKNVAIPMAEEELNKLRDLQWAYDQADQPAMQASQLLQQREIERAEIESQLSKLRETEDAQTAVIRRIEQALAVPDRDQLVEFAAALPVSVPDIVRDKIEKYQRELEQKNHAQLLEDIVRKFMEKPERYPVWLQYMVIHFSGMRYQSAHGSWADPKDLLLSLRIKAVTEEIKKIPEDAIYALCEQKFVSYRSALSPVAGQNTLGEAELPSPPLARTTDPQWKGKIEHLLKALDPARQYNKRSALLDLRVEEENYDIEQMTDQQALQELEGIKDQLPDWMWKEVVQRTDLKLKEVKDAEWERLSPADLEQRYTREMSAYRQILEKWKQTYLTGWREAHDLTSRLVVTRAVCNEVAEHIQHLRGHSPPGGLTAKPEWYLRCEKNARLNPGSEKPYFVKAKTPADFKSGASILWLNWVNKEPNIWQITRPLVLNNGEELVPILADATSKINNTGNTYLRTTIIRETAPNGSVSERTTTQWLRWMHEATVVEVAETGEGPVVLTFETALPFDDPRQSTIGVFKRYAADLAYFVTASAMRGVFVGYVPEGAVPFADLREMLNWNKILLRNAYPEAQLQAYWQKVEKPVAGLVAFDLPMAIEEMTIEAAPPAGAASIVCYDVAPDQKSAVTYEPRVELARGVQATVAKTGAIQIDRETYYRVIHCEWETRAQDLYLRASEIKEATDLVSGRA